MFFDHLDISWQYEPCGFEGHHGERYLPDFFLPEVRRLGRGGRGDGPGIYVEVKGSDEQLRADARRIGACIDYHATPISDHGLLILGDIPRADGANLQAVTHCVAYWREGVGTTQLGWENLAIGWALSVLPPLNGWYEDNASETLPDDATTVAYEWDCPTFRWGTSRRTIRPNKHLTTVAAAYRAARSARFEHGQSGAT